MRVRLLKRLASTAIERPALDSFTSPEADPLVLFQNFRALGNLQGMVDNYKKCLESTERMSKINLEALTDVVNAVKTLKPADSSIILQNTLSFAHKRNNQFNAAVINSFAEIGEFNQIAVFAKQLKKENAYKGIVLDAVLDQFYEKGYTFAARIVGENALKTPETLESSTFAKILQVSNSERVSAILQLAEKHGKMNDLVVAAAISAYSRDKKVTQATGLLRNTPECWLAMLKGYCNTGQTIQAQNLVNLLEKKSIPLTFDALTDLIYLYARKQDISKCLKYFYALETSGKEPSVKMWQALVHSYVQINDILSAWKVLDESMDGPLKQLLIKTPDTFAQSLAVHHATRNADYLNDMIRFSMQRNPEASLTLLMRSLRDTNLVQQLHKISLQSPWIDRFALEFSTGSDEAIVDQLFEGAVQVDAEAAYAFLIKANRDVNQVLKQMQSDKVTPSIETFDALSLKGQLSEEHSRLMVDCVPANRHLSAIRSKVKWSFQ